jgi:hypothetical protein
VAAADTAEYRTQMRSRALIADRDIADKTSTCSLTGIFCIAWLLPAFSPRLRRARAGVYGIVGALAIPVDRIELFH